MRFIRKGGRIIPIKYDRDNYVRQNRSKARKANAISGAAYGTTIVGAKEAITHAFRAAKFTRSGDAIKAASSAKASKIGMIVAGSALATSAAAGIYSGIKELKARKAEGPTTLGSKFKENLKQSAIMVGSAAAVVGLHHYGLKGALASKPAIKKAAGAVKEEIKFRKAKKVKWTYPVRGLLTHGKSK